MFWLNIVRNRKFFRGLDLINELRAAELFAETATQGEEKRYIDQLRDKAFGGALEPLAQW